MKNDFKNILIIRTDRIGDVILTMPAIGALRDVYPKARISMLVAPLTKDIAERSSYIDEVFVDDRKKIHKGAFGFFKLAGLLRQKKFDCAIVYHTKKRTNSLCFFAGIKRRIGYKNEKFGFFLTDKLDDPREAGDKHESEYCVDVVRYLDDNVEPKEISFVPKVEDETWAKNTLLIHDFSSNKKIIAVHPGASDPDRCWPISQFAELMEQLKKEYGAQFVLMGAGNILEKAQELKTFVHFPIIDLSGKTTIGQSAALLKRCSLLISNDSGPIHIASAVGTPVVSIFVRNYPGVNPTRWKPLGEKVRVIAPLKITKNPQFISNSQVLEAVDSLFKLC